MMRIFASCLFSAIVAGALPAADAVADSPQGFQMGEIRIDTRQGRSLKFDVYLALSREQQTRGLMQVTELGPRQGMLFVYPGIRPVSMWMKNTPLPLDIVFIRDDGTIARIARNTTPNSLESIRSGEPVRGALELNAGVADAFQLSEGDLILSGFFGDGKNSPTAD